MNLSPPLPRPFTTSIVNDSTLGHQNLLARKYLKFYLNTVELEGTDITMHVI